jgi:hypothetical protein
MARPNHDEIHSGGHSSRRRNSVGLLLRTNTTTQPIGWGERRGKLARIKDA